MAVVAMAVVAIVSPTALKCLPSMVNPADKCPCLPSITH